MPQCAGHGIWDFSGSYNGDIMTKIEELAMKCVDKFERDTLSLNTEEYNSLNYEVEEIIKEVLSLQRIAIIEDLSGILSKIISPEEACCVVANSSIEDKES